MSHQREELLETLKKLDDTQFAQLLSLLKKIDSLVIATPSKPLATRAQELIKVLEQHEDGLKRLEEALEHPSLKILSSQSAANPIKARVDQIVSDYTQLFVGRDKEEQQLDDFLTENSSGMLLVRAGAGMGKTALLANWKQKQQQQSNCFIAYHFFRQGEDTSNAIQAYRYLLRQLYTYYELTTQQIPTNEYELKDRICHLLQEPRAGKPLVILLDALDEASPERSLSLTLPQPLPEGLYVIASIRVNEAEKLDNLPPWIQVTQELPLKHLPSPAVADWLRRAGNGDLATLAQDKTFVAQVCDRTEGIPLFLKYLIDELVQVAKQGEESAIRKTLVTTPKGFANYIRQQYQALDRLEDWRSRRDLQKIFYFLTIAKGELSSDDLVELMEESPVGLPWQVSRWFKIRELEDYLLFSFAHPSLAEQFAALPAIKANTKKAQKELINYCAHWQEYLSAYALRHYAEHLRNVKQWEVLYAIAQDEDFASTQQQQLPDEPDLPLKTVQIALLGAAEEDKAERMAEFVLIHAHRLRQTNAQESPLEALRSGSLKRAWVLGEHFEIERCILWYLLLAWELKDEGKLDDARETLQRLQQKDLPCFPINGTTRWQGEYAAYLLAYIFEVSEETCTALAQKFFPYNTCCLLCNFLIEHGNVNTALKIAEWIILELKQWFHLPNILKAQVEKGNNQETKIIFAKVLEITRKTFPSWCWVSWIGEIAKAQMEVGHREEAKSTFADAIETVHKIENPKDRTSTLIDIADSQANIGLFSDARETLQRIDFQGDLENAWVDLAKVQEKIGDKKQAQISYSRVKQIDPSIEDTSKERDSGLPLLRLLEQQNLIITVTKQAKAGQFDDAFQTVSTMKQQSQQEDALVKIAVVCIHKENLNQAWKIANLLYNPAKKLQVIQSIATRQVQAYQAKEARDTLAIGLNNSLESEVSYQQAFALLNIAEVQLAGQNEKSINTVNDAYEIAKTINNLKDKINILAVLGEVYAKVGQRNEAKDIFTEVIEIVQRIEKQNSPNQVDWSIAGLFTKIGVAQARAGEFDAALETIKMIKLTDGKALVLKNLAQAHLEAEQRERLKTALTTVYEDALSSFKWGFDHPANTLSSLAVARMELGEREAALANFAEACELVKEEKVQKFKINPDSLLSTVAVAQAEAREFDTALQNAHQIEDKWEQVKALSEIASFQWKKGDKERLSKTLHATFNAKEQITDEQKRIGALWLIAQMQAMAGKVEQALRTAEQILTNRNQLLCHIATNLTQLKDKDNFKKLLIPCAYSLDTAYKMCGYLAYLYPEKAESIAEIVKKFMLN